MIKSMTGFGVASTDYNHAKITVEIKSLNSKFLEISLKLPKAFSDKEFMLRNICNKDIERGKVSITIGVERATETEKSASINKALLISYYHQLQEIDKTLGAHSTNLMQIALNMPEVINYTDEQIDDSDWTLIEQTFNTALANFNTFRLNEGNMLKLDLELRIKNILAFFGQIDILAPQRVVQIKQRLHTFLEEQVGKVNIDHNRLEQELIYYIDKLDITEEKTRLMSHCDYFITTLKDKDANGKKLGFIAQEIGREINTMGSKANDAAIQQLVVGMKEELEKIKEQLLNIL